MGHRFDPANVARLEDPARLSWQAPAVVIGLLDLKGDETVIDFGAGSGVYTLPLAEALPLGRVLAVDLSTELLEVLRSKLAARPDLAPRIDIVQSTDERVPLEDGVADAILAVNMWHEVHDERASVDEVVRLLAPGGRLLSVDWAPIDRPVGPPNDTVLSVTQSRDSIGGLGLELVAVYEAGELFPYHHALLARKPDTTAR